MKKKSYISGESCEYSICNEVEINNLKDTLREKRKLQYIVEYSKILSNKTRSSIIYLIYTQGSLCVCDLANILNMSSQAISSQLIKLFDKGIFKKEKKGLTVFYSILDEQFIKYLKHILYI